MPTYPPEVTCVVMPGFYSVWGHTTKWSPTPLPSPSSPV